MTTKIYNLNEFERIGRTQYELPENVLASIRTLCSLVGYVETTQNTYINQYNATAPSTTTTMSQKKSGGSGRQVSSRKPKETSNEWKRPVFKATVFAEVDDTQALINDIRVGLNKIKESNCDENIAMFIEKIDKIQESIDFGDDCELTEKMQQVFDTIYTICISNKMFSKIYATVLVRLFQNYGSHFNELFDKKISEFLESMQNIVDVNANDNYDAFCEFTAKNNSRKNIANLLCEIAKLGEYENIQVSTIVKMTSDLLNQIMESVELVERQKEVEEITENIVIIFSHFDNELKTQFKTSFEQLALLKKPGLTSRTRFKYMDLVGK
jgi:hypothetical protein